MRIALHLATLRGSGSGFVGRNTLREIVAAGKGHQFFAWIPSEWNAAPFAASNLQIRRVQPGPVHKARLETLSMPRLLRSWKADVLFSLGDTSLPRPGIPHVLLVQQPFVAFDRAEWGFDVPPAFALKLRLMESYFRLGISSVSRFIVQIEAMKNKLSSRWRIDPERITVVPSAVDPVFLSVPRSMGTDPPYVCYVADSLPHKNHTVLAPMMRKLRNMHPTIRCRLTGHARDLPDLVEAARRDGVLDCFDFLGRISSPAVANLLAAAVAMVMPSRLESFGLPYYESMAIGCPVITSDRPFAREACGPAGLYADPDSGEQFAFHCQKLLESEAFALDRSRIVRERFNEVSSTWTSAAREYLRLLESL